MILVGIDTGVHTGVAIWNTRENYFKMIMPTHAMSKKLKIEDIKFLEKVNPSNS